MEPALKKKKRHIPALGVEGKRPNQQYIQSACKKNKRQLP